MNFTSVFRRERLHFRVIVHEELAKFKRSLNAQGKSPAQTELPQITAGWCWCWLQSCKGGWRTCSTAWGFFQLELELMLRAGFPSSHLSHLHAAEVVVPRKLHRQEYTGGDILFMAADFAGVPHRITETGFTPLCCSPTEGSVTGQQGQAARSPLPLLGKLWLY